MVVGSRLIALDQVKQLRLGHVGAEDAVRLREIMNVEGISVEDLTRRVVRGFFLHLEDEDRARQEAIIKAKSKEIANRVLAILRGEKVEG